jgi:hypothetical protein
MAKEKKLKQGLNEAEKVKHVVRTKNKRLKELSLLFNPKPLKNIINSYKTMPKHCIFYNFRGLLSSFQS